MSKIISNTIIKLCFLTILVVNYSKLLSENITDFVYGIEDLPLFLNMKNNYEKLVMFDANEGRFVTSEISGKVKYKDIKNFYEKVLPNLGWKEIQKFKYQRDNEVLTLEYTQNEDKIYLIFNIISN